MRRNVWSTRGRGLLVAVALLGSAASLEAQNRRTVLTVSGLPLTIAASAISTTHFDAGSITIGTVTFAVDLTTNNGGAGFSPRVTTVQVRCSGVCPTNVARIQWRRNDLAVWNALTTAYVTVESRTAFWAGTNDPWSNTMIFRRQLAYDTDATSATQQYRLQYQLLVTAP